MNRLILIFSYILLSAGSVWAQNAIVAGEVSGQNIHYTNLEPDSAVSLLNGGEQFLLDIDKNGTHDLAFIALAEYQHLWYAKYWTSVKILNDKVRILSEPGTFNLVVNLKAGDSISEQSAWSTQSFTSNDLMVNYLNFYPPPGTDTTYGYLGSGYLGFSIQYTTEKVFGWIAVQAMSQDIVVSEMAVRGLTVGINEMPEPTDALMVYPNPCISSMQVKRNAQAADSKADFEILNAAGQSLQLGQLSGNTALLDVSALKPGYYVLVVKQNGRVSGRTGFCKAAW